MQEMQIWSLGQEYPLEEEMATHSSILAWKSHAQRSLASYSPWGHNRVEHKLVTKQLHQKVKIVTYFNISFELNIAI